MGHLVYGLEGYRLDVDDRTLAHLQIVIAARLRQQECFLFAWTRHRLEGSGRTALWLAPGIPLRFEFDGSVTPWINREWLQALTATASTVTGLHLVPEPAQDLQREVRTIRASGTGALAVSGRPRCGPPRACGRSAPPGTARSR